MSYYTNNGGYGTPFGWGQHQEQSGYYTGMSQQNVPVTGNPSSSGQYVTGQSRRGSYMPAGYAPNMDSWQNYASPDLPFSGYGAAWQGNQHLDQTRLNGSSFGAPGSGNTGPQMGHPMGMGAPDPLFDHVNQVSQRSQPHSSSSQGWTQIPGSHRQSTSWDHPERTARQHSDHNSIRGALGTSAGAPPFQPAGYPMSVGHREQRGETGYVYPDDPVTHSEPVPAPVTTSPSKSRGEWWVPQDAVMFQCLWTTRGTRCSALIAGDRRSITSHLRDKHGDFTSDGTTIECGWAGCSAPMQRRNIPRHILACHLEVKVPCPDCGLLLSRADANRKHQQSCPHARG